VTPPSVLEIKIFSTKRTVVYALSQVDEAPERNGLLTIFLCVFASQTVCLRLLNGLANRAGWCL
jgi:hypothetical protein